MKYHSVGWKKKKILKSLPVKDFTYYDQIHIFQKLSDLLAGLILVFYFFSPVPDESKVHSLAGPRPGKKFLVTDFLLLFLEIPVWVFSSGWNLFLPSSLKGFLINTWDVSGVHKDELLLGCVHGGIMYADSKCLRGKKKGFQKIINTKFKPAC